ncbi:acetylcholinesterase-like [Dermacentor andersoni]|uniref:acetylcholinesterase-like n=1 Tax=Dermacentor andersoni TaxID=34620 RepID=UPI0024166615|nr:acetylcholinesterase-like [Dermacentor andersoni]
MLHENSMPYHVTVLALLVCGGVVLRCLEAKPDDKTPNRLKNECPVKTLVNTANGPVKGFIAKSPLGKPVRVFYGIPYGKPPIGQRRFDRAERIEPWTDVFDATVKPNSCFQVLDTLYGNFSGSVMWNANTRMSEDCLKLNVWTPGCSPSKKPFAVLVWIYGGGFYSGTSTLDVYDARTLVSEENVVVVSMNYRVASLGFLSFGNEHLPGNAGLYDQHLALRWVRENIAAFGGNPTRVTLFGESAGAVSVGLHILSPLSKPLFARAILQSGSPTVPWGFKDRHTARKAARRLATALRCPDGLGKPTLNCLRSKDAKDIVKSESNNGGIVDFPFVPVEDGAFLPGTPQALMDSGAFARNISVMLGSNVNEGSYFLQYFFGLSVREQNPQVTTQKFAAALKALDPSLRGTPVDKVLKMYTAGKMPSTAAEILKALDSIVGDYHFTCPVVRWADRFVQAGIPAYQYVFARRYSRNPWPLWMGVIHGEEVAFVFGEPLDHSQRCSEEDKSVSRRLMRYWANFAKTVNPNFRGSGWSQSTDWPRRTNRLKQHLVLDVNKSVGCAHRDTYCKFWRTYDASIPLRSRPVGKTVGAQSKPSRVKVVPESTKVHQSSRSSNARRRAGPR